jgi:hypothetical protein
MSCIGPSGWYGGVHRSGRPVRRSIPPTSIGMPCLAGARLVFQSRRLSAVPVPSSAFAFPSRATPVRRHVGRSRSWRILIMTFQLHVRTVDVSLIHVVLWRLCLTRNLICSASTMLFAMQSADVFSMSMDYVNLQRSPFIGVLIISPTCQSSPGDSTVPSSSPCTTASKRERVSRTRLRFPYTTLSPVKWPL